MTIFYEKTVRFAVHPRAKSPRLQKTLTKLPQSSSPDAAPTQMTDLRQLTKRRARYNNRRK